MAHPFAEHKENKVAHDRVKTITKGYAAGGGVLKSDDLPNSMSKSGGSTMAKGATGLIKAPPKVSGKPAKPRLDRPAFARGGRANGKTNVNVIVAPGGGQNQPPTPPMPPPMPPPQAAPPAAPPHPPMMPPPGAGPGPGMPPSGLAIRKRGGRVNKADGGPVSLPPPVSMPIVQPKAKTQSMDATTTKPSWMQGRKALKTGGRVENMGAAKKEGMKNGTQVTHTPGKNDLDDISSKPPALTRKKGGRVYPIDDGAGGGEGRLEKIKAYGG